MAASTFRRLAGELVRGRRFTKADYVERGLGSIHYGEVYTDYGTATTHVRRFVRSELRAKLRLAHSGDLVIAATGENVEEVGKAVAWLGADDVAVHDDCYIFRHGLDPKYVAYFFQSASFQEQKKQLVTESKLARISGRNLEKIKMPVPPLEVQREIVSILDKMEKLQAELQAELRAELQARSRQYDFHREELLDLRETQEVQWLPLADLLREPLTNGRSVRDGSGYPVLRLTAVRGSVVDVKEQKRGSWDAAEGQRFRIEAGDLLVVRGNGSKDLLARCCMVVDSAEVAFPDTLIRVRPNLELVSQRFLFYVWKSAPVRRAIDRAAKATSGVWKISQDDLARVVLPVPDLAEQERIVAILDRFDALVNDLTVGLPAEITARRQQYEYYRNKLLTFPERPDAA